MSNTVKWMGVLLAVLFAVAGCVPGAAPATGEPTGVVELPYTFEEGFEDGLAAWQLGDDVPEDPNNPGRPVAWDIQLSDEQAASGEQSARLTLDGRQADGIIWLARGLDVPAVTDVNVHLSFSLWSPAESFSTLAYAAAYAGSEPPTVEEDFDTAQPADQVEGWRQYEYDLALNSGPDGQVWIAVGVSVVWETEIVYYLDEIEATIAEAPGGSAGPGDTARPPTAWLIVGEASQESGIGSYCWTTPGTFGQGVGVCADTMGVITPAKPLAVPAGPLTATFRLQLENPAEVTLNVFAVAEQDEVGMGAAEERDWRAWTPAQGQSVALEPQVETGAELVLDPGLYVLSMFARWDELGDVNYGWLVQVGDGGQGQGEAGLTVEEYAIVADAEDKPTHLEYRDRIDPAILARREAWRDTDPELRAAGANETLAPFGYRLEPRYDAEWGQTFFDLYAAGQEDPVLTGLMNFRSPAVSASGARFAMAVENAPNSGRPYLLVTDEWIDEWQADQSVFLPPVYAGEDLVAVQVNPALNLTYVVVRGGAEVYSGQTIMEVEMPVRSLSGWGEHWALEVDDHVILDGEDLGARQGYDAMFGFHVLGGQPFYFYRQGGAVYMSYAGQTLPETYDEVVHNQCCEPSMFNVAASDSMVWFHALRDGTWFYVEAGLFGQEPAATPGDEADPAAGDLPFALVPFTDLVADPASYGGTKLCTSGVYLTGFEVMALGAATEEREGYLYLTEPTMWVGDPAAIHWRGECTTTSTAPEYEFCEATVCGTFETGGPFGHLGGYQHQIW